VADPEAGAGPQRAVRFRLPRGDLVASVTAAQMREIDRVAVEETGPSLPQMLEHAGRSLAEWVVATPGRRAPELKVLVVAGSGGHGAGGVAAARHLRGRVGRVEVLLAREPGPGSALESQARTYRADGGLFRRERSLDRGAIPDLVVDALFGYGLRGAPTGADTRLIEEINGRAARVVSLDLPSGLPADGAPAPGVVVRPEATLTLHLPKPALRDELCGRLFLAALGIPADATRQVGVEPPHYGAGFVTEIHRVEGEPLGGTR